MLLPYFLDRIPEQLGRLYAKLTDWHPEGKNILLAIDESGDPTLFGTIISGVITRLENVNPIPSSVHDYNPPYAIIQLDSPLNYQGRKIESLGVQPRFYGHGFFRLLITWNVVNIYPVHNSIAGDQLSWDSMIAIGLMKLAR
jgi:hypothetical protein